MSGSEGSLRINLNTMDIEETTATSYRLIIERSKPDFVKNYPAIVKHLINLYKIKENGIKTIHVTMASNAIIDCADIDTYNALLNKEATGLNNQGRITALKLTDVNNIILFKGINHTDFKKIDNDQILSWGIVDSKPLGSDSTNITKVICKDNAHTEQLLAVKSVVIDYKKISIARFEARKSNVVICFKCAKFGHIAADCKNDTQCYKCSDKNHAGHECPSKTGNQAVIKCPSCSGPHPQTFPGCQTYIDYQKQHPSATSKTRESTTVHRNYSAAVSQAPNTQEKFFTNLTNTMNSNFQSLTNSINEIKNSLARTELTEQRSIQNQQNVQVLEHNVNMALNVIKQLVTGQNSLNWVSEYIDKNAKTTTPYQDQRMPNHLTFNTLNPSPNKVHQTNQILSGQTRQPQMSPENASQQNQFLSFQTQQQYQPHPFNSSQTSFTSIVNNLQNQPQQHYDQ